MRTSKFVYIGIAAIALLAVLWFFRNKGLCNKVKIPLLCAQAKQNGNGSGVPLPGGPVVTPEMAPGNQGPAVQMPV